ncbi:orotidine-5'-phosphate decarboxylase [uncultured Parolsenella sp.]|uniref:orotidine-5'-phosphate decarboxylase n=1 Tax=uncultured Parolsenella sp. TaxID=2083008 RepID=UPI0025D8E351|nr:orotidine-5'-phosphate decarboxylase [uncultured Parolsenella sp.]
MGRFDTLSARDRVMVALDCSPEEARELADKLEGHATWLKVGITLIYDGGLPLVEELKSRGFKVFVDAKFHDIPHQVRGAVKSAAHTGADLVTAHGCGGAAMLAACHEGAQEAREAYGHAPYVIAITVLTSMDSDELGLIGVERPIPEQAAALAKLAVDNGLDGIVCSPQEAHEMRELLGPDALIVTPGVRPAGAALGDQSRVATPAAAIKAGASHIVVGRPITQAPDPVAALESIVDEIETGC